MSIIVTSLLYGTFCWFQWYVCMNSCAKSNWEDESRSHFGIYNFNIVKSSGKGWCLIPVIGFFMTYSFITINQKINWKAFTFKYIPSAWEE